MRDDHRIAQLEALLARIRSRSRLPRGSPYLPDLRPRRTSPPEIPTPLATFDVDRAALRADSASGVDRAALRADSASGVDRAALRADSASGVDRAALRADSPSPARQKYTSRPEVPVAGLLAKHPPEPSYAQPEGRAAQRTPGEPPPMEVVELEVDPDPSIPPPPISAASLEDRRPEGASVAPPIKAPLESRSRLVSAPPFAAESLEATDPLEAVDPLEAMDPLDLGEERPGLSPSDPTIEVAADEVSSAELDALEEESAPTSSRRQISIEAKMSELDDDVAPLHTPPPESGRLPAALPNFELAFEPAASELREEPAERPDVSVIRAEPPDREIAAFVTTPRGDLGAKTFGELLDDALSL